MCSVVLGGLIAKCLQKIPKKQRKCRILRIIIQNMPIYNSVYNGLINQDTERDIS